jgi:hypothetical protein
MDVKPKRQLSKLIRNILPFRTRSTAPGESVIYDSEMVPSNIESSSYSIKTPLASLLGCPGEIRNQIYHYPLASLLGCPGEIRNQIYQYLFDDPTTEERLKILQYDGNINPNTAFLQTCHQVYSEARHIARSSFLLVPKHKDTLAGVKCVDSLTLPFNDQKIIRILQGPTPPELLKTLVLREYLHNLILYWHFPIGTPSIPINLRASTIYVQLCICESVPWILLNHNNWINTYGFALMQFLESYPSVNRIVTFFCGLEGDSRFHMQTCVGNQAAFPKLVAQAFEDTTRKSSKLEEELCATWVVEEASEKNCYVLAALPGSDSEERAVKIDFYNSSTVCGKKCVLE